MVNEYKLSLLGRSVCAHYILNVIGIRIQECEAASPEPNPFPVFGTEPIHD